MDITIVIPIYNRKEYIHKTLETIDDKYPLILVDNGSTDGSFELCSEIVAHRKHTILVTEPKQGAAAARNKGLSMCQTRWVYFFDSDDIFTGLPISWNTDADVVFFPTRIDVNGKWRTRDYQVPTAPHIHILNSMLNTPGMIFRTEFLRDLGGWNESSLVWNDWELGLRVLLHHAKVDYVTKQSYHVINLHSDSITGDSLSSRADQIIATLGFAFDDIFNSAVEGKERQKAFAALFYRCYILSGKMLMEGNAESSAKVDAFIYDRFRVNRQSHMMGQMLRWASAKGVRGVWRIALRIV